MAPRRKVKRKVSRRNFREGDALRCSVSGKVYIVELFPCHLGERWLLRSVESDNPGTPKNRYFIQHQIEDGFLIKEKPCKARRI